jgi:hypothetical protein
MYYFEMMLCLLNVEAIVDLDGSLVRRLLPRNVPSDGGDPRG